MRMGSAIGADGTPSAFLPWRAQGPGEGGLRASAVKPASGQRL